MNMVEEAALEFRLRKINETRNYHLDEINCNHLFSEKYKKTCKYSNYVEHLLILFSTVTGCFSRSPFASLVFVLLGITSYAVRTSCAVGTSRNKFFSLCNHSRN